MNSLPRDSIDIGRIMPRQFDWRSPGLLSTCRDHKHFGQWLVYPLPKTSAPQWAHVKFSTHFVNLFITGPMHHDTFLSIHQLHLSRLDQVYAILSFGEYILGRILRI